MEEPEVRTTNIGIEYGYFDKSSPADRAVFGSEKEGCLKLLVLLPLLGVMYYIYQIVHSA